MFPPWDLTVLITGILCGARVLGFLSGTTLSDPVLELSVLGLTVLGLTTYEYTSPKINN